MDRFFAAEFVRFLPGGAVRIVQHRLRSSHASGELHRLVLVLEAGRDVIGRVPQSLISSGGQQEATEDSCILSLTISFTLGEQLVGRGDPVGGERPHPAPDLWDGRGETQQQQMDVIALV
jgi:hypothetical protein